MPKITPSPIALAGVPAKITQRNNFPLLLGPVAPTCMPSTRLFEGSVLVATHLLATDTDFRFEH